MSDEVKCRKCGRTPNAVEADGRYHWTPEYFSECPSCDPRGMSHYAAAKAAVVETTGEREARIRAEAAAERTAAILEILRRHDLRDCSPGYLADTIETAFPKSGGDDVL